MFNVFLQNNHKSHKKQIRTLHWVPSDPVCPKPALFNCLNAVWDLLLHDRGCSNIKILKLIFYHLQRVEVLFHWDLRAASLWPRSFYTYRCQIKGNDIVTVHVIRLTPLILNSFMLFAAEHITFYYSSRCTSTAGADGRQVDSVQFIWCQITTQVLKKLYI